MKKLILRLLICSLVLCGTLGYGSMQDAASASGCAIATQTTAIGNGTLAYSQIGSGRPILLLHGLFASKEQWDSLMCQLSQAGTVGSDTGSGDLGRCRPDL